MKYTKIKPGQYVSENGRIEINHVENDHREMVWVIKTDGKDYPYYQNTYREARDIAKRIIK